MFRRLWGDNLRLVFLWNVTVSRPSSKCFPAAADWDSGSAASWASCMIQSCIRQTYKTLTFSTRYASSTVISREITVHCTIILTQLVFLIQACTTPAVILLSSTLQQIINCLNYYSHFFWTHSCRLEVANTSCYIIGTICEALTVASTILP